MVTGRRGAALAFSILIGIVSVPLAGQETVLPPDVDILAGYAVLERGPLVARGVPVLPANTFPYLYGSYSYEGVDIEVYLVPRTEPVADGRAWERAACEPVDLEYLAQQDLPMWRVSRDRYLVYIAIPAAGDNGPVSVCGFAGPFVEVFEFFLAEHPRRLQTLRPPPEFPAVLELSR